MTENELFNKIIEAAIDFHKILGPGLLEPAYDSALNYDLKEIGIDVMQQEPMPFVYKEIKLYDGYRLDLQVEEKVIVEIKSVEMLAPVHFTQSLTYLKLSNL